MKKDKIFSRQTIVTLMISAVLFYFATDYNLKETAGYSVVLTILSVYFSEDN